MPAPGGSNFAVLLFLTCPSHFWHFWSYRLYYKFFFLKKIDHVIPSAHAKGFTLLCNFLKKTIRIQNTPKFP